MAEANEKISVPDQDYVYLWTLLSVVVDNIMLLEVINHFQFVCNC